MKDGRKILFIIDSYQQYQTYIQTQSLKEIRDDAVFIVNPKLANMDFGVFGDRIFSYSYPERKDILHRHIFNININRRRHKRFWIRSIWFKPHQKRIYWFLSLPIVHHLVKFIFLQFTKDKNLTRLVKKINPDIVVIPSHAFEGMPVELIRIAKKIKTPSFMVIDNWDTLANRTLFTIKPDYLGVWSEQQIDHAILSNNMFPGRMFILGAPKFSVYMKPETALQPSPYPFKYVLYVGMSDLFDELGALRKLDEAIERQKLDIKIVYRPNISQHTRKCPDVFFEYDFRHVILDTPARSYYKKMASWDISQDGFNPIYYPDFSYYPKLLSNMEFMICAHSTMILEALLFNKKIYLLAYDDGFHRFGPHWAFENAGHLFGIERLKNVRMVRKKEDLGKIFTSGDELKIHEPIEPLDIDYFISKEATANYAVNFKKAVNDIMDIYSSKR